MSPLKGLCEEDTMDCGLALITQDRWLEKVMRRVSKHFGYELSLCETCSDFVKEFSSKQRGVVVIDACICSQPHLMDVQAVINEAHAWQAIYLPRTNRKQEIKEAMAIGAFGCLHQPVNEKEVRQMLQSALGI